MAKTRINTHFFKAQTSIQNIWGNMTSPNRLNAAPVSAPGEMKMCALSDGEFKIAVLKKLSELEIKHSEAIQKYIRET